MSPDIFAEWFYRQGHSVLRTESSYWVDFGPRVYQAFPYHWLLTPTEEELNRFLQKNKLIGLRYSTPIDAPIGRISYHAVYEDETYEISQLSKWSRKNVRRGLRNCTVESISFDQLAKDGWELQVDTLDRQQHSYNTEDVKSTWKSRCMAAKGLPGFEAWGAIVEGQLAASVITFLMDDCIYMLYQQCHRDFLREHVNNALGYVVTNTMIKRPEVKTILYGLHSLDAPSSVDEFKFRMGYSAKPVRQRVVFHPWFSPLFNSMTHRVLKAVTNLRANNLVLAKSEGMVRFYLEGKRPLEEQARPNALEHYEPKP
jgi:hypothetical protein